MEVFWDDDGEEQHYATIHGGDSWNVTTYEDHEWVYRTGSGAYLGGYTVGSSYYQDDYFNAGGCSGSGNCGSISNSISGFIYMGEYNGSKYFCSDDNNNSWADAVNEVASHGGHIVVINDAGENDFIQSNILADYAWIGYTDEDHEGDFDWVNGDADGYTHWNSGEPNDQGTSGNHADHTVIRKSDGRWFDRNGDDHYEYVMEIPCNGPGGDCNEEISYWSLDDCESFSSNGSNNVYTEFTAETSTPSGFSSVEASILSANSGPHSCVYGVSGAGICHGIKDGCSWSDNHPNAYIFSVTVNPSSGQTAKISGLTFYEMAPLTFEHISGNSGDNDPPSKYGIRVLKDGVEIFQETDIATTHDWSFESFDFSDDPDFEVTSQATFSFELLGYCRSNGTSGLAAWDLDEIKVLGCSEDACVASGGDSDGDDICDDDDCAPNDPNLPATPGTACDDGNPNTVNDQIQADGCSCEGTFDPCVANGGDSDDDGVCDNDDCAPNDPNLPATPGTACDDGNPNTSNDQIQSDGCLCEGTPNPPVCENVTFGGTIGFGSICAPTTEVCDVAAPQIENCDSPSGGSGAFEIIWLKATNNPNCVPPSTTVDNIQNDPFWEVVTGETGLSLDPGLVTEKTCYLRCTRRENCTTYIESNIISIDIEPGCGSGGGDPDCDDIEIITGNGTITVSGLDGAPISSLQIFNSSWGTEFSCFADCSATQVVNVPAGDYFVYAKYYTASYGLICQKDVTVTVGGGGPCDDADGDGTCDNVDCQPNDANFPATPGSACDDGNSNTTNDQVTSDGCGCEGTPTGGGGDPDCADISISADNGSITVSGLDGAPVTSLQIFNSAWGTEFSCFANCSATESISLPAGDYLVYAKYYTAGYVLICQVDETITVGGGPCDDADGDGTCDADDCQPNDANFPATPGTACNDGNPNTENDQVTSDGCGCAGTPIQTGGCTPEILATWDLDACASCSNGSNADWSELLPLYSSGAGCNLVAVGGLEPVDNSSTHSCTPGASGTAVCIQSDTKIQFEVIMNGNDGALTNLSFFERAPHEYVWESPNNVGCSGSVSGDNNPPSKFRLKVFRDGVQVFNTNYDTESEWNLRSIDFTGNPAFDVSGNENIIFRFEFRPNNPSGSGNIAVWDIDEISVSGCCGGGDPDPCAGQGGDSDGDGVCDNTDCQPNNANFPATPGTACNDGNPNTDNDQVTSDGCGCEGIPSGGGDPDCADISITTDNGSIIVSGLDGAPVTSLQIFNSAWGTEFSCFANCSATETIDLPNGDYLVFAKYYTAGYALICQAEANVTITGGTPPPDPCTGQGGDSDGDGVCDNDDCQPNNASFPANPGSSCNDGNPDTENDQVTSDGCGCEGTLVGPEVCVDRDVSNSKTNCGSGINYGFYADNLVHGISEGRRYTMQNASFEEFDDGTASLTGTAVSVDNSNVRFAVSATLSGRTLTAPSGSPKESNCYDIHTDDWYYYTNLSGTLTGQNAVAGGVINISLLDDIAFQVGTGANLNDEDEFGGSSWLDYSIVSEPDDDDLSFDHDVQMDFNLRFSGEGGDPCDNTGGGGGNPGGGTGDCADIQITTGPGQISVSGLNGAPITSLQIFNSGWGSEFACFGGCSDTEDVDLAAGSYYVYAKYYNASWQLICEVSETVTVNNYLLGNGVFDFEAAKHEEHSELIWVHNAGQTVLDYTLERSLDGVNFETIYSHESKGGTSSEVYQAYDFEPAYGDNIYRVRLDLVDGRTEYSHLQVVNFPDLMHVLLFPNPANDFVKANLEDIVGFEDVTITIFNNLGVAMKQFELDKVHSRYYQMDIRDLREGHYVVWFDIPGRRSLAKQLVVGKM